MIQAGLWCSRRAEDGGHARWRPRRSSRGELVQWDTSEHDWLESRGEKLYLIHMIDDARELVARSCGSDSTEENLRLLWTYLERHGRRRRSSHALRELGIVWIGAHSPQARGRVERSLGPFRTGW